MADDIWFKKDGTPSARHGRGKRYRARYVDDTSKPREAYFHRKRDAEDFEAGHRTDVNRGQYIDPGAGRITVGEYAAQWRETLLHGGGTAEKVESAMRVHVVPILGGSRLGQVRPSHVRSWVKDRSTLLAPSTMKVVYGYLSSMFQAAALDRKIGVSPCQGIALPERADPDRFIPTADQIHAVAGRLPDRYAAAVYLAAGCGHRVSEMLGTEIDDLNFLGREVAICRQIMYRPGQPLFLAAPKTTKSRRTVELGQVGALALARHIELFPPAEVDIEDLTNPRKPIRRTARLLFTSAGGEPVFRSTFGKTWDRAVAGLGLPKSFGFHSLRHYFATLLIHNGASVKTVQLALGHSRPSITLDTYVNEWPDAIDRTRNIVDAALTRSLGTDWAQNRLSASH